MILPCEKLIKYLYLKNKDISKFLKIKFLINVDDGDIKKVLKEMPAKPQKSIIKSRYKEKLYNFEKKIGITGYEDAVMSLAKLSNYKRLLFFINTALYRQIDIEIIKNVINSIFTEEEYVNLFKTIDLESYRDYVFNFSDLNNYYENKFTSANSDIADFNNTLTITEAATRSDIYVKLDADKVVSDILNVSFFKAMRYLKSHDKEDIRLGKILADFSIKNLKETKAIVGEANEDEIDNFTIEFEKNDVQKPVMLEELPDMTPKDVE